MKLELINLLSEIDSRFSGPKSRRLFEMISGKREVDYNEIERYLNYLKNLGGDENDKLIQKNQQDAADFLEQFLEHRKLMKV
ncbi:MAG TPA: hypothetical protein PK294_01890 [Ignavibacteria bacterium]|nr:hypothetical protein [Ignavibacteria bacterium]HQY51380.1 hypothetical protein [Ignavibacteria bacterium]HRA99166.1 hypothetical protein [Ignavibacteria bacterium]